jgi:phage portal protein BeeE
VEFHSIGLDAVDLALISGKNISDERIALIFGYPPELLKADNKYDNAINALRKLVTNGLYSDLVAYRNLWNYWVLPMMGYNSGEFYVDFDISVLPEMQSDMEKMAKQAIDLVGAGIITPNEGRVSLKYDNLNQTEMDMVWINSGRVPITEAAMPMQDVELTGDYENTIQ